jgi:hypothetical protein
MTGYGFFRSYEEHWRDTRRLATMCEYYRREKCRLEFELKLLKAHPIVVQSGFCLN